MALNAAKNGYKEVAIPFYLDQNNILDGDEDAQVFVLEDGVITNYALKLYKWRLFFNLPLDCPLEDEAADHDSIVAAPDTAQQAVEAHVLILLVHFNFLLAAIWHLQSHLPRPVSMWAVSDFQSEIDSTCLLLQARPNVAVLQSNLGNGLVQKLNGIKNILTSEIVQLYDVIQSSRLPNDLKASLTNLLDAKAAGMESNSNQKVTQQSQKCDHVENYLTAGEQEALQRKSPWEGAAILASRLRLLGVMSMKESTKKKAVGLLCWYDVQRGGQPPSHDSSYALAQHMLQSFQSSPTQTPVGAVTLQEYPMNPNQLSPAHLQASYGDDKPCPQDCPGLASLIKFNLCVRSTCGKLSMVATQKAQQTQQLQKQHHAAAHEKLSMDPDRMAHAFSKILWDQFCRQSEEVLAQSEAKLTFLQHNLGRSKTGEKNAEPAPLALPESKQLPLALPAPSTQVVCQPQQPQATPVEQHPATLPTKDADSSPAAPKIKTLEDFENETYDTLKTRKAKAKAKAKSAACEKKPGGMKRPASANSKKMFLLAKDRRKS
eukprot:s2140_g17.t1